MGNTTENYSIADGVKIILSALGVDLTDENFTDTPNRVAKAFTEILSGQNEADLESQKQKIFSKSFPTTYKGIVAQKHIKAIGMCPHHLQPIKYDIDLGYIANKQAVGLSKLARVTKLLAGRLVLQESLTQDILDIFVKELKPAGVMVIVRGEHGCMSNRGISQNIITTTSSISGIFEKDIAARQEFLTLNGN